MRTRNRTLLILIAAAIAALALAACGGDDDSSDSSAADTAATTTASGGSTVSVQSIDGQDVLVDAGGAALYTNDMDTPSKIACTDECAVIWVPLSASVGEPQSDDSSVQDKLGTVDRPDGTTQVTFDGMPLYAFSEEDPGELTGDGVADSFGGTNFVWTVASTGGGTADAGGDTSTSDDSGGGGYGGSSGGSYGY